MTAPILQTYGQVCSSKTPWCSFMMHLSCNLFLSAYRIYMMTKGGTLMCLLPSPQPFEHPSFSHLLPHASCCVRSIGAGIKERGKPYTARGKRAGRGNVFWMHVDLGWPEAALAGQPKSGQSYNSAVPNTHRIFFPSTPLLWMPWVLWWRLTPGVNLAVASALYEQPVPMASCHHPQLP